jgi:hypothetical protein
LDLKTAVDQYLRNVHEFGRPMPLISFDASKQELESSLSAWDEDYHLHRHFELLSGSPADGEQFVVNGVPYSAIIFLTSVRDALG